MTQRLSQTTNRLMKLPMKMHINSIKAVLNVCLSVKMFKNMARVVFFKHFSGQEHIFNKAFVRVLGFSSSSFMTLVVVRHFFCNMLAKKHSLKLNYSPFRPLEIVGVRIGNI